MFDALIREVEDHYGLGPKARQFVAALLAAIFNPRTGGFGGFQSRFEQAGSGDLFRSWIGGTPGSNALQPDQFSGGVGDGIVGQIADRLHVPHSAITLAGATILPRIIALLTRDGIPHAAPASAASLISEWEHSGAAAAPAAAAASGSGWWKWLALLAALVAAFLLFKGCSKQETAPAPVATPAPVETAAPAPVAQVVPRFTFENTGGKVTVGGLLQNPAEPARLLDALRATFGADNVSGDIGVDAATGAPLWLDILIGALPELKAPGLKFAFEGNKLTVDTSALPEDQRFAISKRLRELFAEFEISGLWERATAALRALKPGFTNADLTAALNLMDVHFHTGSARITNASLETLTHAAAAIKQAPAGTRFEVGGHTDNVGDAASNLTLSQQRSEAVIAKLVELGVAADALTGKGYGQDKPIADNNTEEGRAQNRRIHFTAL